jgi:PAS domain S-box-containing protein
MISSAEQIQILYEISLSIGDGDGLRSSVQVALSAYLRKLNCSAGAVFYKSNNDSKCYFNVVQSIPKRLDKNPVYQQMLEKIPIQPGDDCDSFNKYKLPLISSHSDGSRSYLMKLGDLGLLFMIQKEPTLSLDFIYSLKPLNEKFAESIRTFILKDQLDIHSAALESSTSSVLITNTDGIIEWANSSWIKANQYELFEVSGFHIDLLSVNDANISYAQIWSVINETRKWEGNIIHKRKDGSTYLSYTKMTAVLDQNDGISHYVFVSEDITEKYRAEKQLKENESLLSTLLNTLPDMVWLKNKEGQYITCNTKFENFFGATLKEIKGKTDYDFVDKELADLFRRYDKQVIDTGITSVNEEELIFASDGHKEVSETIKTAMRDDAGEIMGTLGISRDITRRKKDESAILESKQRFEDLTNLLPQPIWEIDSNGLITYMNEFGKQLFGLSEEVIKQGYPILKLIPKDFHEAFNFRLEEGTSNEVGQLEIACYDAVGELMTVMVFANSITYSGRLIGYRGIIFDVSNLKKAENELMSISALQQILIKISTQYINVSIDQIDNAIQEALQEIGEFVSADRSYIFRYDHQNRLAINTYEWCNDGIEPQIQYLQEVPYEALDQWIDSHFKGDTIYISDVSQLIDQELKEILESQDIKSLITVPMLFNNQCVGFVGFDSVRNFHQYSENEKSTLEVFAQVLVNFQMRIKTEKDLKEAKEKAEKAEKAQFNFLSTMSHEIRTPMNAVVGLSNILLMENPKSEQIHNLNVLKQSSQNLLSIINDILDYNKLISGNVILEQKNFNLSELFKTVYHSLFSLAENKGINFTYSISPEVPENIVGDSTRITQILNNLVSNSIKFTKKGKVRMAVKLLNKSSSKAILHFSVSDTGIGIPKDKFEDIFEEFKQSSESITREFGGTGLGLPIVRKLLNVMESDIYLESEEGKGSIFSFTLELQIGGVIGDNEEESDIVFDDSLYRMRVLVVEDNKINQMVVHRFLTEWKCKIDIADNGQIALNKIQEKDYDVILMDLHMPVMDGYTATNRIRDLEEPKKKSIPIIALSASALGEIEVRARKFGMDAFVTKPFVPKILFKTIKKFKPETRP